MASNLPLIVFLVLVSFSLTSGYSRRYAVSKHDDESYVMATSDHGSSMTVVEDVAKTPSPQALFDGSKVVSKSSSSKSKKKKHKRKKVGSVDVETCVKITVAIILAIIVIICVTCVIYYIFYVRPNKN